ncbi:OTU domain-containing protein 3 isoform X3 [Rhipicephalus microplus]|uniref:OTU domain-containing protein 3 isoform X3 n=1 Tax=Rhipicephalus microplus TaxID=6941 RepID=UPI003F6C5FDC
MARRKSSEKCNQQQKPSTLKQKNKANSDDENFTSFKDQLKAMGLTLREIQGDGSKAKRLPLCSLSSMLKRNCLFRALNDQLEGHTRNHLKYRFETVQYMKEHRNDFEPFVEDDVPFDQHLHNLGQPGTYAGNDAIVAFAKLRELVIVIHQLNTPLWQVKGTDKPNATELHLSYHNGDHYNSVRKIGDNTQGPASIRLADLQLIKEALQENAFNKVGAISQLMTRRASLPNRDTDDCEDVESAWNADGLEPLIVNEGAAAGASPKNGVTEPEEAKTKAESTPGQKKRLSSKAKKEIKKQERKQRNIQRKKGDSNTLKLHNEQEAKATDVIVADFKYLTI